MIPSKFYHYSSLPIESLDVDFYEDQKGNKRFASKPIGFWISVEDFEGDTNWKTWCIEEKFHLHGLKHKYLVKLKENARILYLSQVSQIKEFSLKYRKEKREYLYENFIYEIKWEDLQPEYDGIIIAPYQYECRLYTPETSWYYGWDCASGCIWNLDCIESFTLEEILEYQEEENEKDSLSEECSQRT